MAYTSKNLFLAAVVALSVYVPFETVAKVSLVASAILFIADPLPPYSRLIALVSCWTVLKLNAAHQQLVIRQQHEEEQASMEFSPIAPYNENESSNDKNKKDQ